MNPSVVIIRAPGTESARPGQGTKVSETGPGFLISAQGPVITAAHVVQTADSISAELLGGEQVSARVVASESAADVAHFEQGDADGFLGKAVFWGR